WPSAERASRPRVFIGREGVIQREEGRVPPRSPSGASRYVEVESAPATEGGPARDPETRKQYLAFADALTGGAALPVTPEAGRMAVKLALFAETSLRARRGVAWNELPDRG